MNRKTARELIEAFRAEHPEISEYWCIHERVHAGTLSGKAGNLHNLPRLADWANSVPISKTPEEILEDIRFVQTAMTEHEKREESAGSFEGCFEAVHRRIAPHYGFQQWESTLYDKRQVPWEVIVGPMPKEDFDELDRLCARRFPVAMWAKLTPDQFVAEVKTVYAKWRRGE